MSAIDPLETFTNFPYYVVLSNFCRQKSPNICSSFHSHKYSAFDNLPEKYLLSLGTLQPRTNLSYLVDAFAKASLFIPHTLILAGAKAESFNELNEQVKVLGISERVIFTGYTSDEERVILYNNAEVFVYPSKYEGFGLVLLEAMSYSKPIITTNVSSLPEVLGKAGILVDLDDAVGFSKAIVDLVLDDTKKAVLVELGLKRCEKFKWHTTAVETLEVYQSLIS